jgi:hypothetical protein
MALVAASIAAAFAYMQFRHTRQQQVNARWWDTLTWVYDRTVVENGKRAPLPQGVTLSMLVALYEQAKTSKGDGLQEQSIASVLEMFSDPDDQTSAGEPRVDPDTSSGGADDPAPSEVSDPSDEGIPVTDPRSVQLLHDLKLELRSRGHAPAWSASEAVDYEAAVVEAMRRTIPANRIKSVLPSKESPRLVDLEVRGPNVTTLVAIKFRRRAIGPSTLDEWVDILLGALDTRHFRRANALVITNVEPSSEALERLRDRSNGRVAFLTWSQESAPEMLAAAITRMNLP